MIFAVPFTGVGLVILFLILILLKKKKHGSDILLTLFFLLIGAELLYRTLILKGVVRDLGWLVFLDLVYWILLGPTIYLYATFILRRNQAFQWRMLLHLIPLGIVMIPWITYCIEMPEHIGFFSYVNGKQFIFRWIIDYFWEFCVLVYFIVLIIKIIGTRRLLYFYFSSLKHKDLSWLLYLTAGFATYIIACNLINILYMSQVIQLSPDIPALTNFVLIGYLIGTGIYGYKQEGIFSEHSINEISNLQFSGELSATPEKETKYLKSGMNKPEYDELIKNLKVLMKKDKPYLDGEITIQDLSKKLNTSVHKLSQAINENFQMNFFDFINSYRIEEVKKLLQDSKNNNLKIISLAYDCGFNSKSAFYSSFKKNAGTTPREYRKRYQPEHARIFSN
jgi:AraC-like DNA-binding protein